MAGKHFCREPVGNGGQLVHSCTDYTTQLGVNRKRGGIEYTLSMSLMKLLNSIGPSMDP